VLAALADRFVQRDVKPGDVIVERGAAADAIYLVAHGKINKIGVGKYGDTTILETLADGDHFTYSAVLESQDVWEFTAKAVTSATILVLQQSAFEAMVDQHESLKQHIAAFKVHAAKRKEQTGEAPIELAAGAQGRVPPARHVRRLRAQAPRVRARGGADRAAACTRASPTSSTTP
jgi:CRP-like cAMP-binding protein